MLLTPLESAVFEVNSRLSLLLPQGDEQPRTS
jgi:hypothetical protein